MKIISDEPIEELPLPTIDSEGKVHVPAKLGRGEKVPRLVKELVAIHTNLGMNQSEAAKLNDISQTEVSRIERGVKGREYDQEDEELKLIGQQAKHKIVDIATTKLMKSLNIFEPSALKQSELPGAAAKLAAVTEKLSGNAGPINQTNFIVYQPRAKSESDFGPVITVED